MAVLRPGQRQQPPLLRFGRPRVRRRAAGAGAAGRRVDAPCRALSFSASSAFFSETSARFSSTSRLPLLDREAERADERQERANDCPRVHAEVTTAPNRPNGEAHGRTHRRRDTEQAFTVQPLVRRDPAVAGVRDEPGDEPQIGRTNAPMSPTHAARDRRHPRRHAEEPLFMFTLVLRRLVVARRIPRSPRSQSRTNSSVIRYPLRSPPRGIGRARCRILIPSCGLDRDAFAGQEPALQLDRVAAAAVAADLAPGRDRRGGTGSRTGSGCCASRFPRPVPPGGRPAIAASSP